MRLVSPLLVVTALGALALAAACSNNVKNRHFEDDFAGTGYPAHGWVTAGPTPVIDTTSGDPAPSLTWIACAGSNGAVAHVDEVFDATLKFDARISFSVYGAAATSNTGVVFHIIGSYGDDAAASILPAPTGIVGFEIDGNVVSAGIPAGANFHQLEFAVDQYGESAWLADGAAILGIGPLPSTSFAVELVCGEGDAGSGPVPVLLDNLIIDARVN